MSSYSLLHFQRFKNFEEEPIVWLDLFGGISFRSFYAGLTLGGQKP